LLRRALLLSRLLRTGRTGLLGLRALLLGALLLGALLGRHGPAAGRRVHRPGLRVLRGEGAALRALLRGPLLRGPLLRGPLLRRESAGGRVGARTGLLRTLRQRTLRRALLRPLLLRVLTRLLRA
jgi:hypothetical protein